MSSDDGARLRAGDRVLLDGLTEASVLEVRVSWPTRPIVWVRVRRDDTQVEENVCPVRLEWIP